MSISKDIYDSKLNGKGIIEKPLPFFAFHQNEPCRTFVLSAFILVKYPFLLSKPASVSIGLSTRLGAVNLFTAPKTIQRG